MTDFLQGRELQEAVEEQLTDLRTDKSPVSTQELLDQQYLPRLHGYTVQPGKVSDSIFGGKGGYRNKKNGELIEFENPPLTTKDGLPLRIMVRTDRISTHDINRGSIPFKDQVLAMNHHAMREIVRQVHGFGTSQFDVPGLEETSVVIAAENLQTIPLEMVMRRYMAKSSTQTSLYHAYMKEGKREFCGHHLPEGLIVNGHLPYVMDTPSTKSDEHDESVAPEELYQKKICTPLQYLQLKNSCNLAFAKVWQFVEQQGLLLVDTKTEHGINSKGEIVSQDELYTLDSSRYWKKEEYQQQLEELQEGTRTELELTSFSKEYARDFSAGEKEYTPEQRMKIAVRYIESVQELLGKPFVPNLRSREERVVKGLEKVVSEIIT